MADGNIIDQLSKLDDRAVDDAAPPSEKIVDFLHARADVRGATAVHHLLGTNPGDAAPGTHKHEAGDSYPLWANGANDFSQLSPSATLAQTITKLNIVLTALSQKVY